ncbi:MAG: ABC-ATPase domain-containing protein [Clostridiaceae bacterium]|nr:ABC-ATPase domain-containing protein [Clostridiaceae bacterium]
MKSYENLQQELQQIDGRGYKAYKDIKGQYQFSNYILAIDHVQSDPFAPPSKCRVILSQDQAKFPLELFDKPYKRIAVIDFLTRLFAHHIYKFYDKVGGSGKSGLLSIGFCGQQILDRTSIVIDQNKVEARFELGLPAAGRRILGRSATTIFSEVLPQIVENTLYYHKINQQKLKQQVDLSVDQQALRRELKKRNLVAFVANDSILPRESGVSDKPMSKGVIAFKSPASLEVEINLPIKGPIKGMGINEGITLIVGGGYHGKSTLLQALELGVYNHIPGDGREYVITREDAMKIRAEDGRHVEKTNISPFINNLPNQKDTIEFSTENASGSTSQAANIMEALEIGSDLLLIDEDTSATNFMIRDAKMQQLVSKEKEPITPFIHKVRQLYHDYHVSTVLVIGGSGDYFEVADTIIMMDEYIPKDVTTEAKNIYENMKSGKSISTSDEFGDISDRIILKSSFPKSPKGITIKARGLHTVTYNKLNIDLNFLEQLVDSQQTNSIAVMLEYMMEHMVDNKKNLKEIIASLYHLIEKSGLDAISPYTGHPGNLALPRKQEVASAISRYRNLKVK